MTVKQLYCELAKAMVNDPEIAKKEVLLSDDEEGNGFHSLYFGITSKTKEVKETIECSNGVADMDEVNYDNVVILG